MGHGIYSQCTNNYGSQFTGTDLKDNCMYDMSNIATLATGYCSRYVETKMSGTCYFEPSYFYEAYAAPGVQPGCCNFVLGFGSPSCGPLTVSGGWQVQTMGDGQRNTAYLWTIAGGIPATLESFAPCGDQSCLVWTVGAAATTDGDAPAPPKSERFPSGPEDGSDYQGPPQEPAPANS